MSGPGTIVFLGPSLPLAEAQALLPGARFCPPARCGDVLGVLRLRPPPRRIALIDGAFEQVGAVWHKELLAAMARGVTVYGAASMGALRAAELCELGMIGVGPIFAAYRDGRLRDDGDVAVLHAPAALGYVPLTDALVNIGATVDRAVAEEIIGAAAAAAVLARARATFYQRRLLLEVIDAVAADTGHAEELGRLRAWLASPGNAVDQKRLDALALLRRLREEEAGDEASGGGPPPAAPPTIFLRALQAHVACRPLSFDAPWLPEEERRLRRARLLGPRYRLLRTLALALSFVDAVARREGLTLLDAMERADDCTDDEVSYLACLFSVAAPGGAPDGALAAAACALLARAFGHLLRRAPGGPPRPLTAAELLGGAAARERRLGLDTQERLDAWLRHHSLIERRRYAAFLAYAAAVERYLSPYSLNLHGFFSVDDERPWLELALGVCGADGAPDDAALGAAWRGLSSEEREALALECDLESYAEVERCLGRL